MTENTRTTEQEAINYLLTTIGESPVSSLVNNTTVDVAIAKQFLSSANREVQSVGWSFNTERNYKIVKNSDGHIILPAACIKVDTTGTSKCLNLVQRSGKMYDADKNTFVINQTVYVDMVLLLDYEEIPETARNYIKTLAARKYQDRMIGDHSRMYQILKRDEAEAKVALKHEEGNVGDHNILTDSFLPAHTLLRKGALTNGGGISTS